MELQTPNSKLRERALQDNVSYNDLVKLGISKEQSAKGAAMLEEASGRSHNEPRVDEEVRRLTLENQQLKNKYQKQQSKNCGKCGRNNCPRGSDCFAYGEECGKCHKKNHFARVCRSSKPKRKNTRVRKMDDETDSDESVGRILTVSKVGKSNTTATIHVKTEEGSSGQVQLLTDTGVRKTLLNVNDWNKVNMKRRKLVKTSRGFRPYGTTYKLPIIGKAQVHLKCENGAEIKTWVYVINDKKETSLLGEHDAIRLGIVKIDLKGAKEEVVEVVRNVQYQPKSEIPQASEIVSGGETQEEIDKNMEALKMKLGPELFTDKTGKFKGKPIPIQMKDSSKVFTTTIQPARRVPLQYRDKLDRALNDMIADDIIEGPIEIEEPGMY